MTRSKKAKWLQIAAEALGRARQLVYTRQQLVRYLDQNIALELRTHRPTQSKLPEVLEQAGLLSTVDLFPLDRKPRSKDPPVFTRYTRRPAVPLAIAQSLRAGSYLCHSTAAALYDVAPAGDTIYVNKEQGPKPRSSSGLTQDAITRAFAGKPRLTTYKLTDGTHTYVLLNGKQTGDAGVQSIEHRQGPLRVTTLARTVVDLVVRPQYARGAQGVLDAVRKAISRVSVDEFATVLETLDHLYPYHQALGFYLERAGCPASQLTQLLGLGAAYDFYLEHQVSATAFDARWRIHYPAHLD